MLGQRRGRWPSIDPALDGRLLPAGIRRESVSQSITNPGPVRRWWHGDRYSKPDRASQQVKDAEKVLCLCRIERCPSFCKGDHLFLSLTV